MTERRRFDQKISLSDRIAAWAEDLRERAANMKPGVERDNLLRRAGQADTAQHLKEWANSPGLQPPK